MSDGSEVLKTTLTPVIPAEAHGFSIKVGMGPYPPDEPRSHRRAVYAELRPMSLHARAAMEAKNRERILGMVPLTLEGAEAIAADPAGRQAEHAAKSALREAVRFARSIT